MTRPRKQRSKLKSSVRWRMKMLFESLKHYLRANGAVRVEHDNSALLATFRLWNGRSQTIKLTAQKGKHGEYVVLRCQSRASVAKTAAIVREALLYNYNSDFGGCALDTSTDPKMIDITHHMILPLQLNSDLDQLTVEICLVAAVADSIEQKFYQGDEF